MEGTENKGTYKGSVYWWRWASEITRSIAQDLKGYPLDDLDPLMAWIDEQRREKVSLQRASIVCCYTIGHI